MINMSNRLKNELSPYLIQHSENPVDWFPWSDEAFEKSKVEDKPIFLSIGYSTCHWCHVMEKESFEDEEVADLMNQTFVNIKVDREERPDIDNIYMDVCQVLTGSGGWPLTIIMTPEKIPFFAGTYFPKRSITGRIGMIDLINRVRELWQNNRDLIYKTSDEIIQILRREVKTNSDFSFDSIISDAIETLHSSYDRQFGGFGVAPKFPIPHQLLFLLQYSYFTDDKYSLEIVKNTLYKMRLGGIFDQIGYGFHRYSTDRQWIVPHFEKMLYDQALMTHAFVDAFLMTKDVFFKLSAEQILEYVQTKLYSDEGAFYSGEDADSEGVEGKFYVWEKAELNSISNLDSEFISKVYNISENGNFTEEHGHLNNKKNILYLIKNFPELASEFNISAEDFSDKLNYNNSLLFDYRESRIHPFKDDKVLTDWNGLMITAFAKAGRIFNNQKYIDIAKNSVEFTLSNLTYHIENKDINTIYLYHRYRKNQAGIDGNLDDYAFFVFGLLELFKSSSDVKYLELAVDFTKTMLNLFEDNVSGGFYFTSERQEDLIIRKKIIYDGAIPSGNSVALNNLVTLFHLTGEKIFIDSAGKMINFFAGEVVKAPSAYSFFLFGLQNYFRGTVNILINGDKENQITRGFLDVINNTYIPNLTLICLNKQNQNELKQLSEYTEYINFEPDKPAVYFCHNFQCSLPVYTIEELKMALEGNQINFQ